MAYPNGNVLSEYSDQAFLGKYLKEAVYDPLQAAVISQYAWKNMPDQKRRVEVNWFGFLGNCMTNPATTPEQKKHIWDILQGSVPFSMVDAGLRELLQEEKGRYEALETKYAALLQAHQTDKVYYDIRATTQQEVQLRNLKDANANLVSKIEMLTRKLGSSDTLGERWETHYANAQQKLEERENLVEKMTHEVCDLKQERQKSEETARNLAKAAQTKIDGLTREYKIDLENLQRTLEQERQKSEETARNLAKAQTEIDGLTREYKIDLENLQRTLEQERQKSEETARNLAKAETEIDGLTQEYEIDLEKCHDNLRCTIKQERQKRMEREEELTAALAKQQKDELYIQKLCMYIQSLDQSEETVPQRPEETACPKPSFFSAFFGQAKPGPGSCADSEKSFDADNMVLSEPVAKEPDNMAVFKDVKVFGQLKQNGTPDIRSLSFQMLHHLYETDEGKALMNQVQDWKATLEESPKFKDWNTEKKRPEAGKGSSRKGK